MSERSPVLFARRLPEAVEARARTLFDVTLSTDDAILPIEELCAQAAGMDGLVVTSSERLTAEVIAALPDSIEIIATCTVGVDHIDLDAAGAREIAVTNTPGVLTGATADIAMLLLLGAARRVPEGVRAIAEDNWPGWSTVYLRGVELAGKNLGIFGMGRIGQAVARRARAFGMNIHYHNRNRIARYREGGAVYHETPESLLAVSHFLSLHCPSTPETRGFLNRDRLALMPEGAIVVNTARGDIVVDDDLIAALGSGRIKAAGLDVFAGEPNIHPGYRALDNCFMLPHLGSATIEARDAMGFICLDNLEAAFAGEPPPNQVN